MDARAFWLVAAASLLGCGSDPAKTTTGGGGASSTAASSTQASSSSATTSSVVVTSATTSGGMPFDCDPPAMPGSLYELADTLHYGGQTVSMCELRGEVVLAVNTAAI